MRGSAPINLLIVLPLTTPEIVMGASLFTLFFNFGAERGFGTVVIAHTLFCLSFVALTVKAAYTRHGLVAGGRGDGPRVTTDADLLEDHLPGDPPGCRRRLPAVLALSIDDYIITSFVAGPTVTFPRRVFDSARIALPPQVHVLATIIMLTAIVIIVAASLGRRPARS